MDLVNKQHPAVIAASPQLVIRSEGSLVDSCSYTPEGLQYVKESLMDHASKNIDEARQAIREFMAWIAFLVLAKKCFTAARALYAEVLNPVVADLAQRYPEVMGAFRESNEALRQTFAEAEKVINVKASLASGGLPLDR